MKVYRESPGVWVVNAYGVERRYRTWAEALEVANRASLKWLGRRLGVMPHAVTMAQLNGTADEAFERAHLHTWTAADAAAEDRSLSEAGFVVKEESLDGD